MNALDLDGVLPAGLTTRQPLCATDYYQHVLYGRLDGTPDLSGVQMPLIRSSMQQTNAVLAADSFESGGVTADYKVLCDETGQMRIDTFTAPGSSFAEIVGAAKAAGCRRPRAPTTRSSSTRLRFPADRRQLLERLEPLGGQPQQQWRRVRDQLPRVLAGRDADAREGGDRGAVQPAEAPNSTGTGGHCFEERDVLCYSPDGGDRNQGGTTSRSAARVTFDCGNDDCSTAPRNPRNTWQATGTSAPRSTAHRSARGTGRPGAGPGRQVDPPCATTRCAVPVRVDGSERTGLAAETAAGATTGSRWRRA